jgi:hypothetical protein
MSAPLLRTPHTLARISPVATISNFPPTTAGAIDLLAVWTGEIEDSAYLEHELQPDDWLLTIVTPLGTPSDSVDIHNVSVGRDGWGWSGPNLNQGVNIYQVISVEGPPVLVPSGRCHLVIAIYRGLAQEERANRYSVSFNWNATYRLTAVQEGITYQALTSRIADVLYTNMAHDLSSFYYNPLPNGPLLFSKTFLPAGNPAIDPDRRVTVQLYDVIGSSPVPGTIVGSDGAWNPDYVSRWGSGTYHTILFMTQTVELLLPDPDNPAAVGCSHMPIGTVIQEEPLGIVDHEGNQLVDEAGNTLIWS